ncbi:hypothetical protein HO173_007076 [Letharia columbiana]|uniref:Uncharacterized protein n=1 Tax=Letharia columbiana TaxID=112416 RepID=A0A8H6FUC1_9LECA|nr:uncharacterized protein HO173_007076 [Letharia columbiana]KAF6234856.1 hypothetical protein HO173_007076 [Letharia columbiana]
MDYAGMEGNEITIAVNVVPLALITNSTKLHDVAKYSNGAPRLSIVSSEEFAWTNFPGRNSPSTYKALNGKRTAKMPDR